MSGWTWLCLTSAIIMVIEAYRMGRSSGYHKRWMEDMDRDFRILNKPPKAEGPALPEPKGNPQVTPSNLGDMGEVGK